MIPWPTIILAAGALAFIYAAATVAAVASHRATQRRNRHR